MKHSFSHLRLSFVVFSISLVVVLLAFISCNKTEYSTTTYGLKPTTTDPWLPSQAFSYPNGNNDLATLGRVLFYDKNLSADNSVACGSCHQQAHGFADNKSFSIGFGRSQTTRNAHSIMNTDNSRFWDGKIQTQASGGYENQPQTITVPFQSHAELNMPDMNALCTKLSDLPYYSYLFSKAFNGSTSITSNNIMTALGAFMDNILSNNTRFDQAFPSNGAQPAITLSQQELDGFTIFQQKCATCHNLSNGFGGTMNQFEDIGLDAVYKDLGRGVVTNLSSDNGRFQVPSLKNVSLSAPYMHDGRFNTLNEVVDFFSDSIHSSPNLSSAFTSHPYFNQSSGSYSIVGTAVPFGFTATQKSDLVAFLLTLTDQGQTADIRFSDPFKH